MNWRLTLFDWVKGKPEGLKLLASEIGWPMAIQLGWLLEGRLRKGEPFAAINAGKELTEAEAASQQQMEPAILLYILLKEHGFEQKRALEVMDKIVSGVALDFLRFNVPPLKKNDLMALDDSARLKKLTSITGRFFNAESTLKLEGERFRMDVHRCHFARYCRELGVMEMATLFCKADRLFFEQEQRDIRFQRTQTLAEGKDVCDFSFELK